MNPRITNFIVKGIGVAGAGLVLYDSHVLGKIQSSENQKTVKADGLEKAYANTMTLDSPSIVKSNLKKGIFNMHMEETMSDFFTGITGYVKGFSSMLVYNIVPAALSVGTLATKGTLSKCFGAGLLLYGGITLVQEVFGIGKPSKMTQDF